MMESLQGSYDNLTYDGACSIIREKQLNMAANFVEVGFCLRRVKEQKLYLAGGYTNIHDMALDKFGMSRQATDHAMNVNKRFSKDGNSPLLAEEYRVYGKSQLQEMLYLTDEQLESVKPDMTVKEIRKVKDTPTEPKIELILPEWRQCEYLKAFALYFIDCKHEWMKQDFHNRVTDVETSPEEIKSMLGSSSRTWYFRVEHSEKAARINLFDEYIQLFDEDSNCLGDYEWFYLAREIQSMWNVWALKKAKEQQEKETECSTSSVNEIEEEQQPIQETDIVTEMADWKKCCDKGQCPPDTSYCRRQEWGNSPEQQAAGRKECESCWKAWKKQQDIVHPQEDSVETLSHDKDEKVIGEKEEGETEKLPQEEYTARYFLEEQKEKLNRLLIAVKNKELSAADKKYLERQKVIVGALAGMVTDLEMEEERESLSHELPVLKNNDQRREWLRSYKNWGLWYKDDHIAVKYYRYVFENGAQLIAEVYERRLLHHSEELFESVYYHLVEGPKPPKGQHGETKWTYHEKYSRFPNSESELIEFLKEIQKR